MEKQHAISRIYFIILLMVMGAFSVNAQLNLLGVLLSEGIDDSEKLMEGYIAPYTSAFGSNLSAGWYNTAKPHKLGGFDLTLMSVFTVIPEDDKTFNLDDIEFSSFQYNTNDNLAPTAAGERKDGAQLTYAPGGVPLTNINTPKGLGSRFIPSPMAQLGIGLPKGTEIIGRYMPEVSLGSFGNMGLWGIGLKHDIKQWVPGLSKLPVLNFSFLGGYTKFSSNVNMSVDPEDMGVDPVNNQSQFDFDDQMLDFTTTSFTANLLLSANLPVVCFYGGLGINSSKSNLKLTGHFPVPDAVESAIQGKTVVTDESVLIDPIDIELTNVDGSILKPRLNVGMRLKFGVITLHGDYTYANYSMVTAGFGISFR